MNKKFKIILVGMAIAALGAFSFALAAPVTPPTGGGTGTGSTPSKGSLLVGQTASGYCIFTVGTDGKLLTASSTATCGVSWESLGGTGILSLNGSGSSTQTFTAGNGIVISTANGVHTFYFSANVATTTIGGLTFTNATGTNMTLTGVGSSTNWQAGGLQFGNATGTNLVVTGVGSSTLWQTSGLQFNNATGTNLVISGVASSTAFQTGALQFNNATGTNAVFTGVASSTAFQSGAIQFNNATGTNLFVSGVASSTVFQTGGLQFNNATGTNITISGIASTTKIWITYGTSSQAFTFNATGSPAIYIPGTPQATSSRSLVTFGPFDIATGNATGTYLGLNTPAFAGDFINFQIASTSKWKIDNTGLETLAGGIVTSASSTISALNFTNATGTNATFSGVASSTNFQAGGLQFGNATGTNLFISGVGSSTLWQAGGLQFNNATGTNLFISGVASSTVFQTGGLQFNNATGTNAFFSGVASSTLFQTGGLQFNNATGTNAFFSGVASSTSFQAGGLQFNNATGTNAVFSGVASSSKFQAGSIQFQDATGTNIQVTQASSTKLNFGSATTSGALYYGDATKQSTNFKTSSFTVINSTTTDGGNASTTIAKMFYTGMTMVQMDCSTNGSPVAISADTRATTTPFTVGTVIVTSSTCTSGGFTTSTFTNTALGPNKLFSFVIRSTPNATTTLNVSFKYQEQ